MILAVIWDYAGSRCSAISVHDQKTKQEVYDERNGSRVKKLFKYRLFELPDDFKLDADVSEYLFTTRYSDANMIYYNLMAFHHINQVETSRKFHLECLEDELNQITFG